MRYRVFCASLADVFDNEVPQLWRTSLFGLIHDTPHLDWLLLTKRIGNAAQMLKSDPPEGIDMGALPNVWIGATIAKVTQLGAAAEQTERKFTLAFGGMSESVRAWSEELGARLKRSRSEPGSQVLIC